MTRTHRLRVAGIGVFVVAALVAFSPVYAVDESDAPSSELDANKGTGPDEQSTGGVVKPTPVDPSPNRASDKEEPETRAAEEATSGGKEDSSEPAASGSAESTSETSEKDDGSGAVESSGGSEATDGAEKDSPAAADTKKDETVASSVLDLQRFKSASTTTFEDRQGEKVTVTLTNLNYNINVWYLLELEWPNGKTKRYHLENPKPDTRRISLSPRTRNGLTITGNEEFFRCSLWEGGDISPLEEAALTETAYAGLCAERIYVRNETDGHRTVKEWVVEFLRDNIWGGEAITTFVKKTFFKDKFLLSSDSEDGQSKSKAQSAKRGPGKAKVNPKYADHTVEPRQLGINLNGMTDDSMVVGEWYRHKKNPGVYVSSIEPRFVSEDILESHDEIVDNLDSVERKALTYLVAFDLERYQLGYSLGTDHPRLGWSERAPDKMVDSSLPGPDGFDSHDPLVPTGMTNPVEAQNVVATFTSGFKRSHGAFKWGRLSKVDHASHYGFMENGVIFSSLQPELATLVIERSGRVNMRTWTEKDKTRMAKIRHARQNGVPIIDYEPNTGLSFPGKLVGRWGPGNWSGSQNSKFRTLRAGMCVKKRGGRQYIIYGYFSSVTPSAMARVFQAYGCRYAMHLDMNALEHTYLAVYSQRGSEYKIEHLIKKMSVLDEEYKGKYIPRFVGMPDNRDFFYLMRRRGSD